ncbi:MAG: hypothetical protein GY820_18570 [Gammaproteobacteria bacterium]|nr:hypothetical protein [Gammaproteobacteria bacterium]
MAAAAPEFSSTSWGGSVLISEGHSYRRTKVCVNDPSVEYWQCIEWKRQFCSSRGISRNNRAVFERMSNHCHAAEPASRETREVKRNLKRRAGEALGGNTTTAVLLGSITNCSEAAMAALPSIDSLKRTIQRERNRVQVPLPLPPNRDTIQIPQEFQVHTLTKASAN